MQHGSTITSVLVDVPGESMSVVTCLVGHPLATQGRAGVALGIAAIGAVFAGITRTHALVLVAVPLSALAPRFDPVEVVALLVLGLTLLAIFRGRSLLPAIAMTVPGLMLRPRRARPGGGHPARHLRRAGLFGIGELLPSLEQKPVRPMTTRLNGRLASRAEGRLAARILAADLARELGTTVVVEKAKGAGSQLGITALSRARPDGCTLGAINSRRSTPSSPRRSARPPSASTASTG